MLHLQAFDILFFFLSHVLSELLIISQTIKVQLETHQYISTDTVVDVNLKTCVRQNLDVGRFAFFVITVVLLGRALKFFLYYPQMMKHSDALPASVMRTLLPSRPRTLSC